MRSPFGEGDRPVLARKLFSLEWSLDLSQSGFLACSRRVKMARQARLGGWRHWMCFFETLSFVRARAGRHFSRTETWGFRVWVAALPQTAFLPFRSLSSVPFPASVCQAVSRAVAAGNNAQVSRLHQPELTSELLWASVFPWAKWGGHPHLLAKPTLTKHSRAAFSLGDVAA